MKSESILVVEDNIDNQELTKILLEAEGWTVRIAADAQQALEALQREHPKLILMDVQLPGMDGLELTRRLRADSAFDAIKIVALTAYAMKTDQENALTAGCDGYISKPIDTRTFPGIVREYLPAPLTA